MSRSITITLTICALLALILIGSRPGVADDQRKAVPRPPSHGTHDVVVRGHVFVGGYFYDPMFGPYPWWPHTVYPYWYYPVYDARADVRFHVTPKAAEEAAVYVDGFYAGIVDDFNNVFQSLPLTPGGHKIVLFLEGYRTVRQNVYLSPGMTSDFRAVMEPLPAGEISERPDMAPPVPSPPSGTYRIPVTPPRLPLPPSLGVAAAAVGFGTLDLYVQPDTAEVTIDGGRWATADEGHFVVQVPAGMHRVEVRKPGYQPYVSDIEVGDRTTNQLNVSLMPGK
jgi:hypothetical protein